MEKTMSKVYPEKPIMKSTKTIELSSETKSTLERLFEDCDNQVSAADLFKD